MLCWKNVVFCFDFVSFVLFFFNYFSQSRDDVFTLFVVELMCICGSGCFKAIREKHMNESDMMFLPNTLKLSNVYDQTQFLGSEYRLAPV